MSFYENWASDKEVKSHHDGDLPLVDIQVRHVVHIHPFESAADAAVCPSQEHHREASWKEKWINIITVICLFNRCNFNEQAKT